MSRFRQALTCTTLVFGLTTPRLAYAGSVAERHDGFYLRAEFGGGFAYVDSTASISNGFLQPIPSTARGAGFPSGSLRLGATFQGLAFGGRLGITVVQRPTIETLGRRLLIDGIELRAFQLQLFASLYPDPSKGWHVDAELGLGRVFTVGEAQGSRGADAASPNSVAGGYGGAAFGLEAGYDAWLLEQWSGGPALRSTLSVGSGDAGTTTLLLTEIVLALTFN